MAPGAPLAKARWNRLRKGHNGQSTARLCRLRCLRCAACGSETGQGAASPSPIRPCDACDQTTAPLIRHACTQQNQAAGTRVECGELLGRQQKCSLESKWSIGLAGPSQCPRSHPGGGPGKGSASTSSCNQSSMIHHLARHARSLTRLVRTLFNTARTHASPKGVCS
jgi:hypothetical protein